MILSEIRSVYMDLEWEKEVDWIIIIMRKYFYNFKLSIFFEFWFFL